MILRHLTRWYLGDQFISNAIQKNAIILQSLADIAGKYGYYVHQLSFEKNELRDGNLILLKSLEDKSPGEKLKNLNLGNYSAGNAWPIEDYEFMRLHEEEKSFWTLNYKDINGDSYFEKEDNSFIYLYISKNEIIDIKSLHKRIIHAIGRAHLNPKIESGDESLSNVQLKIPKKKYTILNNSGIDNQSETINKVKYRESRYKLIECDALKIVREIINAYYFFGEYYPKNKYIYDEIQKEAIQQYNDRYSQDARAVGIWLWDLMELDGLSWDDSIQILRESPLQNHFRAESLKLETYSEHYAKLLHQDYQLACLCVNKMEYLSPRDIKTNKTEE